MNGSVATSAAMPATQRTSRKRATSRWSQRTSAQPPARRRAWWMRDVVAASFSTSSAVAKLAPTGPSTFRRRPCATEDGITVGGFDDWKPQQPLDAVIFCESLTYASDPLAMLERYMGYLADGGCGVVSLYRNRQAITIGKRIERSFSVIDSSSVVHRSGKRWDVRLLRPGAR
jgi:hypothetical protein